MVCYTMYNDLVGVEYRKSGGFGCSVLILNIEYTMPWQTDGHAPSHGDEMRSLAESIIRNIPLEPIVEYLKEEGITSLRMQYEPSISIKSTDRVKDDDCGFVGTPFHAIYEMEIRFLVTEEEPLKCSVRNLMNQVPWQITKKEMVSCLEDENQKSQENEK